MQTEVLLDGSGEAKDTATTAEAAEIVVMATVTVKVQWIGRLLNEMSAKEFLTELAEKQRCHKVEAIPDEDRWRLEGCICGIKAAREELMIRRRRHLDAAAASPKPSTSANIIQEAMERRPPQATTHSKANQNFTRQRNYEEDAKTKEEKVTTRNSLYPTLSDIQRIQTETTTTTTTTTQQQQQQQQQMMIGRRKEIAEVEAERFQAKRAPHGCNDCYHPPPPPPPPPPPHPHPPFGSSAPYRPSPFTILHEYQQHMEVLLNSKDPLVLELSSRDMFEVYNYSDAAVTLIDHQLNPFGILANRIASNYPRIMNELQQLKTRQSFLHTGVLVQTSAGGFPGAKVLLHVVPPTAVEYPSNDHRRSMDALRSAFVNCFRYTDGVLKMNSLCLPAVGCNIYPVSMVADCLMDAVEGFLRSIGNTAGSSATPNLRRIRLVNNDAGQMTQLIACVKRRLPLLQLQLP